MGAVGYYRYKISPVAATETSVTFYKDSTPLVTHFIKPVETCGKWIQIKWLDKNGQYRFFPFIKNVRQSDKITPKGDLSVFLTGLLDNTRLKTIGVEAQRTLQLYAPSVTPEQLLLLSEINTSPAVFLYTGTYLTDTISEWVQVKAEGNLDSILEKHRDVNFELKVTFFDTNTVTK